MKKTFDAVAFMRKRREELSRTYAGLNAEQIKDLIRKDLKDDLLETTFREGSSLILEQENGGLSIV